MKVRIKKLNENAVIPSYSKHGDAGLDLTATDIEIQDNVIEYSTGLAIEIPEGFVGLIFPRSSIYKTDLLLSNAVGIIDSGFRGELKLKFKTSYSQLIKMYNVGDRVGQLIIIPYPQIKLIESEELSNTERGEGGFGHTGN